jgi:tetratricopeptide (TPR) repeat protein
MLTLKRSATLIWPRITPEKVTIGDAWEAFSEFTRLRFAKGGSLSGLQHLAATHPNSNRVLEYLAMGFEIYQDYLGAAVNYDAAAKAAREDGERLRALRSAAVAYARAGSRPAALSNIGQMKSIIRTSGTGENELLATLLSVMEFGKDDEAILALLERTVDINPADIGSRFALAFKYGDMGNDDLAIFHYLRIPTEERTAITWNNLGAAFDNLELPAKSINAYRKAEQMGETLAMSNIAEKLITAGFLAEARQECKDALKTPNVHKNVAATLTRLNSIEDAEEQNEKEILEKVAPVREFYAKSGRCMACPETNELDKYWRGPDCILEFDMQGSEFRALGSYERAVVNALRVAVAGPFGQSAGQPATEHYDIEYRGSRIAGGVFRARVTRTRRGDTGVLSLLGSMDNDSTVIMVLSDDKNELQVMEKSKGTGARFYAFRRETFQAPGARAKYLLPITLVGNTGNERAQPRHKGNRT